MHLSGQDMTADFAPISFLSAAGARRTSACLPRQTSPSQIAGARTRSARSPRRSVGTSSQCRASHLPTTDGLCRRCMVIHPNIAGLAPPPQESEANQQLDLCFEECNLKSIAETAEIGCHFCQLLKISFEAYSPQLTSEEMDWKEKIQIVKVSYMWREGLDSLEVDFCNTQDNIEERGRLTFPITAKPNSCTSHLKFPRSPRFKHLLSDDETELLPQVRQRLENWIQHCVQECGPKIGSNTPPSRLLDLKTVRESGKLYLVDTTVGISPSQSSGPWRYAALSHCWGNTGKPPLKTTRKSLQKRYEGILLSDLPDCYRDTVIVCRSLEIRYLWIDSLCVVQDDKEDWEKEAQKMGQLYQQALITIIPSAAESCSEGFLRRPPTETPAVEIEFQSLHDPSINGSYLINAPGSTESSGSSVFYQDTAESKWGERGWTFSERLFSTRRIYFGAEAIHWSCGSFYTSELDNFFEEAAEYNLWSLIKGQESELGEDIFSVWCSQYLDYSCRQFTFWDDRLPAISALAKVVSDITRDTYLAGVWESNMHNELLWCATKFRGQIALPGSPGYIAPSWSWLARAENAEITNVGHRGSRSLINLVSKGVESDGINPFGRVTDGFIEVKGRVCALTRDDFSRAASRGGAVYYGISKGGRFIGECSLDVTLRRVPNRSSFQDVGVCVSNAREFLLLPIRYGLCLKKTMSKAGRSKISEGEEQASVSGLVLIPTGRKTGTNEYCRGGIFESLASDGGKDLFLPQSKCDDRTVEKVVRII